MERLGTSHFGDPEEQAAEPWDLWVEGYIDLAQLPPKDQKRARAFLEGARIEDVEEDSEDID